MIVVNAGPRRRDGEENLGEFLAERARRTSDGWLAAIAGGGLVVAVGSVLVGGRWALLSAVALCLVAFAAWGISDRELNERKQAARPGSLTALLLARGLAAVMGGLAALAALFTVLALTLGTWIS
ncbi:hypothetical protein BH23GEM2_BH23GEM2_09780 [soil metagenome]